MGRMQSIIELSARSRSQEQEQDTGHQLLLPAEVRRICAELGSCQAGKLVTINRPRPGHRPCIYIWRGGDRWPCCTMSRGWECLSGSIQSIFVSIRDILYLPVSWCHHHHTCGLPLYISRHRNNKIKACVYDCFVSQTTITSKAYLLLFFCL